MQIIISPAKQMLADADTFAPVGIPPFPDKTARIVEELRDIERDQGAQALQNLWNVSDRLLGSSLDALHRFRPIAHEADLAEPCTASRVSPALFSYHGLQYRHIAPTVLDQHALSWLNDHLWILSGLYGCVRPFHAVQPYRLEMGAKLAIDGARNLYGYWGDALARTVTEHDRTVVNLASVEYAKALLPHLDKDVAVVTCIFAESVRNGKPRQVSGASKAARGTMVRWLAEQQTDDAAIIERFDIGYKVAGELGHISADRRERTVVFVKQ